MLLNYNGFIGEIALDLGDPNVRDRFDAISNQVIYDILNDLLGVPLYNAFISDLVEGVPTTQKYTDLLVGKTYTRISGLKVNYEGMKRMLRYFVYVSYLESQHTDNTSLGQSTNLTENGIIISRSQLRKVRTPIQNKAVDLYNSASQFINDNYTTYFSGTDYTFWSPKPKKYIGKITSSTYNNAYFYNRSSEGN